MDEKQDAPQMYEATLVEGQTYVYDGVVYEFNEPKLVDEATYRYLKRNAIKSVSMGEDDQHLRRHDLQYFKFRKVKITEKPAPVQPYEADEDDDDLDEVEIPRDQLDAPRPRLTISEDAPADLQPGQGDMTMQDMRPRTRTRAAARRT